MKYRKPRKFKVTSDFVHPLAGKAGVANTGYLSLHNSTLYIAKGYEWNGNSGFFDFPSTVKASLIHDAMYQIIGKTRNIITRKDADLEFCGVMISEGTCPVLAVSMYYMVRLFGRFFI